MPLPCRSLIKGFAAFRRSVIRSVAIATLLVIYAVRGSIRSVPFRTYLGVAGISTLALTASATPADAWRRRRRRRRWYRGGYCYGDDWGRRRRRRRRRRRIHLYF